MKRNKILYTLVTALLIVFISACKKEEEIGGTAVQAMSGEWWVKAQGLGDKYYPISTFNTSANSSSEMWLDDGFWKTKFKVPVNISALTLAGTNIVNADPAYNITINVTEGKIIQNATKGPVSKAVTDSIYFKVKYSDDPDTYTLSGYRRTRFSEDDH